MKTVSSKRQMPKPIKLFEDIGNGALVWSTVKNYQHSYFRIYWSL